MVEEEEVHAWVRLAAAKAFVVLADNGLMPREEVLGYYENLFRGKLVRQCGEAWFSQANSAMIPVSCAVIGGKIPNRGLAPVTRGRARG